jgi:hypothetical protein
VLAPSGGDTRGWVFDFWRIGFWGGSNSLPNWPIRGTSSRSNPFEPRGLTTNHKPQTQLINPEPQTSNLTPQTPTPKLHPVPRTRFRANKAHVRQPRPDSGLGLQVEVFQTFDGIPSSLECGPGYSLRTRGRSCTRRTLGRTTCAVHEHLKNPHNTDFESTRGASLPQTKCVQHAPLYRR